ncbi:hypothetical protein ACJRO7_032422 [Eucalyptus globulus]|uniref:Uncharacterized protein n=1 Tax=Eucalyptus globulus TaxID=34317 RepID=A0ABD3JHV9_EUCGL
MPECDAVACLAVEEGVWRSFLTRAPRSSRAGAGFTGSCKFTFTQPPSGIYWRLDQGCGREGGLMLGDGGPIRHAYAFHRCLMIKGSVNGSSRTSASSHETRITHLCLGISIISWPNYGYSFQGNVGPNEHYDPFPQGTNNIHPVGLEAPDVSMNLPSPPVRTMMHAANGSASSSGLLPTEQTLFVIGEVVAALSADVQLGDGIDGSHDIMSDGEESVEGIWSDQGREQAAWPTK